MPKQTKKSSSNSKQSAQVQAKPKIAKKIASAIYFTFLTTFALVIGAQVWFTNVYNAPKDSGPNIPFTQSTQNTQENKEHQIKNVQNTEMPADNTENKDIVEQNQAENNTQIQQPEYNVYDTTNQMDQINLI